MVIVARGTEGKVRGEMVMSIGASIGLGKGIWLGSGTISQLGES